jgi:hypothetical protein
MLARLVFGALCGALPPFAAIAQTPPPEEARVAQRMAEELHKKLAEQGFSEVKIVPGSFIVTAKDKDGELVAMLIGPQSTMVFTRRNPEQSRDPEQAQVPEPQADKSKWY